MRMEISLMTRRFYKFLKQHHCLVQFIDNVLAEQPRYKGLPPLEILQNVSIGGGFIWAKTKQGQRYWSHISRLWGEYCKQCKQCQP